MLFIGGLAACSFVWDLGDVGIGLMTIFNIAVILPMSREALASLKGSHEGAAQAWKITPVRRPALSRTGTRKCVPVRLFTAGPASLSLGSVSGVLLSSQGDPRPVVFLKPACQRWRALCTVPGRPTQRLQHQTLRSGPSRLAVISIQQQNSLIGGHRPGDRGSCHCPCEKSPERGCRTPRLQLRIVSYSPAPPPCSENRGPGNGLIPKRDLIRHHRPWHHTWLCPHIRTPPPDRGGIRSAGTLNTSTLPDNGAYSPSSSLNTVLFPGAGVRPVGAAAGLHGERTPPQHRLRADKPRTPPQRNGGSSGFLQAFSVMRPSGDSCFRCASEIPRYGAHRLRRTGYSESPCRCSPAARKPLPT